MSMNCSASIKREIPEEGARRVKIRRESVLGTGFLIVGIMAVGFEGGPFFFEFAGVIQVYRD